MKLIHRYFTFRPGKIFNTVSQVLYNLEANENAKEHYPCVKDK